MFALNRTCHRIALLLLAVQVSVSRGEDSDPANAIEDSPRIGMTLQSVINLAESVSPSLAKAAADVDSARGKAVQAGLYPNPNFDAAMEKQRSRAGWRIEVLPGGHDLMVDVPQALADLLVDLA